MRWLGFRLLPTRDAAETPAQRLKPSALTRRLHPFRRSLLAALVESLPWPSKAVLFTGIVTITLGILITVPALMAFTAQIVNLEARIVQPPTIQKFVVPDPQVTQGQVDAITQASTGVTGCQPGDTAYPIEVPTETCVWWVLRIAVRNNFPTPLTDMLVKDRFGAELDAAVLAASRGDAQVVVQGNQARLTWCVTGPILAGACDPGVGQMLPGDSETLDLLVFTKLNPPGKQAYTSPGEHVMNSGATAKWDDPSGIVCGQQAGGCPSTPPITLTAVCPGPCPTSAPVSPLSSGSESQPTPEPSPEPTATAAPAPPPVPTPTPAPEPTPTPVPSPSPLPTATAAPSPTPAPSPEPSPTSTAVPGAGG